MSLKLQGFFAPLALVVCGSSPVLAGLIGIDYDSGKLYSVSTSNAALTLIGNTGQTAWAEIETAPNGTVYGFTNSGGTRNLYTINPTTAAATLVGSLGSQTIFEGGLAFAPDGTAYGANAGDVNTPELFTINLSTGAITVVGTISGGQRDINGLAWRSDGQLVGLDRVSNSLLLINPATAAASTLASVSATVGAVGGMAIMSGTGYFSTSGPGATIPGSNELYSFNLSTGSATLIGSYAPTILGSGISGLAVTPEATGVPEPGTFALAGLALFAAIGARAAIGRMRQRSPQVR